MESPDPHDPLLNEVDTFVRHGDAAVKLIHRRTGIEVECGSEATQVENRTQALASLRERLQGIEGLEGTTP